MREFEAWKTLSVGVLSPRKISEVVGEDLCHGLGSELSRCWVDREEDRVYVHLGCLLRR